MIDTFWRHKKVARTEGIRLWDMYSIQIVSVLKLNGLLTKFAVN